MALDGEGRDRFAGRGDAVDDPLRPVRLDPDDDHGGDVRVGAGADQGAEVQLEIGAELQPAVWMRQRQDALDDPGHRLDRRVGQVVDRQHDDVVAAPDPAIGTHVSGKCPCDAHTQRCPFRLCTWTC